MNSSLAVGEKSEWYCCVIQIDISRYWHLSGAVRTTGDTVRMRLIETRALGCTGGNWCSGLWRHNIDSPTAHTSQLTAVHTMALRKRTLLLLIKAPASKLRGGTLGSQTVLSSERLHPRTSRRLVLAVSRWLYFLGASFIFCSFSFSFFCSSFSIFLLLLPLPLSIILFSSAV
jgi:hypothetical protein